MTPIKNLISFARDYLQKQPFDIVHDHEHHELVYHNCRQIIEKEGLHPDRDVIEVSAWWHDVEKSYKTDNSADSTIIFLKKTAIELGIDPRFVERCCLVIGQHSYRQSQSELESRILFDADKIEYVNHHRIGKLIDHFAAHPELYKKDGLQRTREIWLERVAVVVDRMHFDHSKQVFRQRLPATHEVLERYQQQLSDTYMA